MTLAETGSPFDDIRRLMAELPGPDLEAQAAVRARESQLVKPPGSLGRLEALTHWLAAWQGKASPSVERPRVAIFASSHGVAAQNVSAYPASVTAQMMATFAGGGAAINQICNTHDIGLKVFDLAVDIPTQDISVGAAMDEKMCAATMAFGMEATEGEVDVLCLGDMGIGNTTVAAAIFHALWGGTPQDWVGPGTGIDRQGLVRKVDVVARAVRLHASALGDPLEVLRRLGGRDIAAMAGAILAARIQRIPVVLDGFVVTAAAAVVHAADPHSIDHCIAAHRSAEPAHGEALARLGLEPLLDLGLRLGEGTGAALAIGLLKSAAACHRGMATFAEAGVAGPGPAAG